MKVLELISQLESCSPESEVRIVTTGVSFGQTPSVGIRSRGVRDGFDWDNGVALIYTDSKIVRSNIQKSDDL
jgi:hypothetical protein